jgi:hypothetical protein
MRKTAPVLTFPEDLTVAQLERFGQGWVLDGEIRQLSPRTLEERRYLIQKLGWFLRHRELDACGVMELRLFLAYIGTGHKEPGGRWGNPQNTRPVGARTVQAYFRWVVEEGGLAASPL